MSNELGLTIPISALIPQLRKKDPTKELEFQQQGNVNNGWTQHADEEEDDESHCSRNGSAALLFGGRSSNLDNIVDEDRMIMPFVRPKSSFKDITGEKSSDDSKKNRDGSEKGSEDDQNVDSLYDDSDDNGDDSDGSDSDQVSISAPPCMPILAVDLEQLCGYKPTDNDDIKRMTDELYETLLGSKQPDVLQERSQGDHQGQEDERATLADDINYVQFTERSTELFESGIAYHSDTTSSQKQQQESTTAIIPYPEFLPILGPFLPLHQENQDDQELQTSLMATSKIWKEIIHPHTIPVVQRLLVLLSKCSRSLLWKYEMSSELRCLAKAEQKYNTEKVRRKHLSVWRNETRPAELAKLYEVRETFEYKIELSRETYDQIMKDKEERVQCELRRRKEQGIGMGGVAALDWDGKETFAFADDHKAIIDTLRKDGDDDDVSRDKLSEDDDGNDMAGYEHDDDFSGSESSRCDKDDSSDDEVLNNTLPDPSTLIVPKQTVSTADRKKRRMAAASKRMRRKLESERENARLLELRQRVKSAHEEEEQMRKMCSTTEEKLALAVVTNLEKKLEKVDSLLETMQEEEWKDQEEGELADEVFTDEIEEFVGEEDISLLDQVLAMILGAFPPLGKPVQAHFARLKKEHEEIKSLWNSTFGRLPLSFADPNHNNESMASESVGVTDKKLSLEGTLDGDILIDESQDSSNLQGPRVQATIPRTSVETSNIPSGLQRKETEIPDDWENIDDFNDILSPRSEVAEDVLPNSQSASKPTLDSCTSVPHQTSTPVTKVGLRPGGGLKP
mmetsp:Transcript_34586/g.41369  ORF Transcript_34586/g.41369 Transcript_34586/m.41369 type:complete len:793 (-) Transcript_34586:107-2485(-)